MLLRQYFKNLSFIFIINILIKPIWVFGVERKFQLWLGQEEYGMYFSYLSLLYILYVVLDIGLHNFVVKLISEKGSGYRSYVSELWVSKMILVLIFTALVIATIFIKHLNYERSIIFILVAFEMLTFSIFQFLRCFTQGLQKFKLDSVLSILDRIFLIVSGAGLLFLFYGHTEISLTTFILFHIISYICCFLIAGFYLRKDIDYRIDTFRTQQLVQILKTGYPLIIITILMSIYTRIDVVLLGSLILNGNEQCGVLAYSNRIIDSAYNALSLLGVFLLPTVANHYLTDMKYVRRVVVYSFFICTVMTISFAAIGYFTSDFIYDKLYHTSDVLSVRVFEIQLWTVIGVGWMYVFGSYLTAIGKFFPLILIVLVGVVLSLTLNLRWIPQSGVLGVAYTSAIVQMTMGILHLAVAMYYLYFHKSKG